MNPQLKKRIFDIIWASLAAGFAAMLSTFIPGIKEVISDQLSAAVGTAAGAIAVMIRHV